MKNRVEQIGGADNGTLDLRQTILHYWIWKLSKDGTSTQPKIANLKTAWRVWCQNAEVADDASVDTKACGDIMKAMDSVDDRAAPKQSDPMVTAPVRRLKTKRSDPDSLALRSIQQPDQESHDYESQLQSYASAHSSVAVASQPNEPGSSRSAPAKKDVTDLERN